MMQDKNRRSSPRLVNPEDWTIQSSESQLKDAEYQSSSAIRLVDISSDGIGIKTKEPLDQNRIISFDLCFSNAYYRVVARVLWTQKIGTIWRSGLQILYMPEILMEEIEEYLMSMEDVRPVN